MDKETKDKRPELGAIDLDEQKRAFKLRKRAKKKLRKQRGKQSTSSDIVRTVVFPLQADLSMCIDTSPWTTSNLYQRNKRRQSCIAPNHRLCSLSHRSFLTWSVWIRHGSTIQCYLYQLWTSSQALSTKEEVQEETHYHNTHRAAKRRISTLEKEAKSGTTVYTGWTESLGNCTRRGRGNPIQKSNVNNTRVTDDI